MKEIEDYEAKGYSKKEIFEKLKEKSLSKTIKNNVKKLKKRLCKLMHC